MKSRTTFVQLGLALVAASSCGGVPTEDEVTGSTSALAEGAQILCQECQPYDAVVKLGPQGKATYCSGGVIGARRILTSAKCLSDVGFGSAITVSNKIQSIAAGDNMTINRTWVHPSFTGTTAGSDVAVVETTSNILGAALFVGGPRTQITPLALDTKLYGEGFQTDVMAYGMCNPNPGSGGVGAGTAGTKQAGQILSIASPSVPLYIAEANIGFCAGDFGGPLFGINNQISGIASRVQFPVNLLTRITPIRPWIQAPTIPTVACAGGKKMLISTTTGKCIQANSGSTVAEAFCTAQASQCWTVTAGGNPLPAQSIFTSSTGQCLGRSGSTVRQINCGTTDSRWAPAENGTSVQYANASTGQSLLAIDTTTVGLGGNTDARRLWILK